MELQFQKKSMPCIRELTCQCKQQELTQEVRLPDGMPDIGRVIGTWGQMLIRGKEWRQDSVGVSGGLMVWILYKPENESACKVVETWLPFNTKLDISGTERDGSITASGGICYQDARSISARKFMLRMGIYMDIQVHCPWDAQIYEPSELPGHVQIKKSEYPLKVPAEIGEKAFSLEDQLPLPDGVPELCRIVRYSVDPEIFELKVLGSRLVFRGIALVHVLYETADGMLCSYDVEIPFSQFTELDHEYEEGADACVRPILTSLEIDVGENKIPSMKAGMTGQYIIYNRQMVQIVEDAYSTMYDSELQKEQLQLPVILQEDSQRIRAEASSDIQVSSVVEADFVTAACTAESGGMLDGRFYVLFYDQDGQLQSAHIKWDQPMSDDDLPKASRITPVGRTLAKVNTNLSVQSELKLDSVYHASQGLNMVTGIQMKENQPIEDSPSMILQRAGEDELWSLAKKNKSSVAAICAANGISEIPDDDRVLIIPVL